MKFIELHEMAILAEWWLNEHREKNEEFYKEHIDFVKKIRRIASRENEEALFMIMKQDY